MSVGKSGKAKYVGTQAELQGRTLEYQELFHVQRDDPSGPRPALTVHSSVPAHQPWQKQTDEFDAFGKPPGR
jgi:hypothetical protein